MAWIESHQELARHPKTRRLARALGEALPTVIGRLHLLWWWALDYADDGALGDEAADDLADALMWEGDPSVLWAALVRTRFIDDTADGARLHDWDDYAGRLLDKRRAEVERVRRWRDTRNGDPEPNSDVTRNVRVSYGPTVPNQTIPGDVPDRTVPDRGTTALDSASGTREPPPRERLSMRDRVNNGLVPANKAGRTIWCACGAVYPRSVPACAQCGRETPRPTRASR